MADEETKPEETTEEVVDETTEAKTEETGEETVVDETPSEEDQKLSDLQSKFDALSQDAERNKNLLDELTPLIDLSKVKGEQQEEVDPDSEEFMTKGEAKAFEKRINEKIATENFIRDFRTNHPEIADKGPKEEMVRYFFEREKGSFDKRLQVAVDSTKSLLKSEQEKGTTKTKAEIEKAAKETKAKAEAAAKASGLSSAGNTTAKESSDDDTPDYAAERRLKQRKQKGE